MRVTPSCLRILLTVLFVISIIGPGSFAQSGPRLNFVGSYSAGIFGQGAAEIVAHDPVTQRLFVVNGGNSSIDVLQLSAQGIPSFLFSIDLEPYGDQANSVDVCNGLVATAVQADVKTDNGTVEFFDAFGNHLKTAPAGALPDMLTFTPQCDRVLVANEGEPNSYNQANSVDPEGSVTIINLTRGLALAKSSTIDFRQFGDERLLDPRIRIFGPRAKIPQDLEPEYIAVDPDGRTAFVTLQENNTFAVLDIVKGEFTRLIGLGFKDHNLTDNKLDASDRDFREPATMEY